MAGKSGEQAVSDRGQIRLLSSPVRQEILDTIAALGGEASVAELADELGRPADGLYYHLKTLVRGGLVRSAEVVKGEERLFKLVTGAGRPLRLTYDLGHDGNARELDAFARGLLQIAGRDFGAALGNKDVGVEGPARELWASRNKGWLSADDLKEVNALLERLSAITSQTRAAGRNRLISLAFVLAPIQPRPKRRSAANADELF
jgi:DNA-binding transcriptional ArsR family regulator